jgi:putative Mg2+ transporter-C (MgtC) family protein
MLELKILGIVVLASFLGGVIGLERELADKAAGMRTHMLVAAAAALFISLSNLIVPTLEIGHNLVQIDPLRMIEALVAGIAFLGAGTIIRHQSNVAGLTTAASLLLVGGVGITVGLSQYALAAGLTALTLIILRGVKPVEDWIIRRATGKDSKSDSEPNPPDSEDPANAE